MDLTNPGRCKSDAGRCKPDPGRCKSDAGRCKSDAGRCKPDPGRCKPDPGRCKSDAGRCKARNARLTSYGCGNYFDIVRSRGRILEKFAGHATCSSPHRARSQTVRGLDRVAARRSNTSPRVPANRAPPLRTRSQTSRANGRCGELHVPQHCRGLRMQAQGIRPLPPDLSAIAQRIARLVSNRATERIRNGPRLRTDLAPGPSSVPSLWVADPIPSNNSGSRLTARLLPPGYRSGPLFVSSNTPTNERFAPTDASAPCTDGRQCSLHRRAAVLLAPTDVRRLRFRPFRGEA